MYSLVKDWLVLQLVTVLILDKFDDITRKIIYSYKIFGLQRRGNLFYLIDSSSLFIILFISSVISVSFS